MPCKLLYVIQVKGFLIKCSTSWPYLISEVLLITIVDSDWPRTFLQPGCFCLALNYQNIEQLSDTHAYQGLPKNLLARLEQKV